MIKPITESSVVTTNIILNKKAIDLSYLKSRFQLVKYSFSKYKSFDIRYKKMPSKPDMYIESIIAFKEQIDYPFYFGVKELPYPSFYVLMPITESPIEVTLNRFDASMTGNKIPMDELLQPEKTNILLRLLLASYFWEVEKDVHRLICQSKFYIFAQKKTKKSRTAAYLSLARVGSTDVDCEEFTIDIEAKNFESYKNPSDEFAAKEPFFEDVVVEGLNYLRQIRPQQVGGLKDKWLNRLVSSNESRASLDWYTVKEDKQHQTRSKIAFDFQKKFVNYVCQQVGQNSCYRREIMMKRISPSQSKKNNQEGFNEQKLPIHLLEKIGVLDNRTKQLDTPLSKKPINGLIDLLNTQFGKRYNITFDGVEISHVSDSNFNRPVLVIHDAPKKAFEVEGILHRNFIEDPKSNCYKKIPHVIKQSIDVNVNSEKVDEYESNQLHDFFDYTFFESEEGLFSKNLARKIEISLNELLLKTFIKNQQLCDDFPLFPNPKLERFCFQQDNTFLYFDDSRRLTIFDISSEDGKNRRLKVLKTRNLDWFAIEMHIKSSSPFSTADKAESRLKEKALIFTDDVCMEIEENTSFGVERVLPNYDAGSGRSISGLASGMAGGVWWHPETGRYAVGASQSLREKEVTANIVRKIVKYSINDNAISIDETLLMQTMCV